MRVRRKYILKNGMHNDNHYLIAVMLRNFGILLSMFMWIEDILVREALTSLQEPKRGKQKTHTKVPEAHPTKPTALTLTAQVQVAEATQVPETPTTKDAVPNTTKTSKKALRVPTSSTTGAVKTDLQKTQIYPPNLKSDLQITKETQISLAPR